MIQKFNLTLFTFSFVTLAMIVACSNVRAQESDEVKRLKSQNELLETMLKLVEKENELLKKEIDLLKVKKARADEKESKKSLSDLLPVGTTLTGIAKYYLVGGNGRSNPVKVTITERDGKKIKGSWVATREDGKETPENSLEGDIEGVVLRIRSITPTVIFVCPLTLNGESLEGTGTDTNGLKYEVALKISK